MKVLSLLLSIVVFGVSIFCFIIDFRISAEFNYLIYMSLLFILMSICIIGILINVPLILQEKTRLRYFLKKTFTKNGYLRRKRKVAVQG